MTAAPKKRARRQRRGSQPTRRRVSLELTRAQAEALNRLREDRPTAVGARSSLHRSLKRLAQQGLASIGPELEGNVACRRTRRGSRVLLAHTLRLLEGIELQIAPGLSMKYERGDR